MVPGLFLLGLKLYEFFYCSDYSTQNNLPYVKQQFLSNSEKKFFKKLQHAAHAAFLIQAKVRLWDIIDVKKGLDRKSRYIYQNKIKQKHIDFILISPDDFEIVLAIEYDDNSHYKKDSIERDNFKNLALEAAKIPLLRIKTSDMISISELQHIISNKIISSRETG